MLLAKFGLVSIVLCLFACQSVYGKSVKQDKKTDEDKFIQFKRGNKDSELTFDFKLEDLKTIKFDEMLYKLLLAKALLEQEPTDLKEDESVEEDPIRELALMLKGDLTQSESQKEKSNKKKLSKRQLFFPHTANTLAKGEAMYGGGVAPPKKGRGSSHNNHYKHKGKRQAFNGMPSSYQNFMASSSFNQQYGSVPIASAPAPMPQQYGSAPIASAGSSGQTVLQNTCSIGMVEPIWFGDSVGETYCRCPSGTYGFSCLENFFDPCARSVEQYFPADASLPKSYFIECSNYIPYLFKCPSGLVWNQELTTCDWPRLE